MAEKIVYKAKWRIVKFQDPDGKIYEMLRAGASVDDVINSGVEVIGVVLFAGNILLNNGITELWSLVTGTGGTAYDSTNAVLGVGDGTTAEDPSQTDLQGTNKEWKTMDSGYPTVSGTTAIWRATFGSTEANFAWEEIGVGNNPTSPPGVLLNRKVQSMGTKTSGTTWTAELQITLS